jgi:hypothetical protein
MVLTLMVDSATIVVVDMGLGAEVGAGPRLVAEVGARPHLAAAVGEDRHHPLGDAV